MAKKKATVRRQDVSGGPAPQALEQRKLDFERDKHSDEIALRREEVELKRLQQQQSSWRSPLFVAVVAGAVGLFSNALVAWINGASQRALEKEKAEASLKLEQQKAEAERILEAIKTGDPNWAAENLKLLSEMKLIDDQGEIRSYLSDRPDGEGPCLPGPIAGDARQQLRSDIDALKRGLNSQAVEIQDVKFRVSEVRIELKKLQGS